MDMFGIRIHLVIRRLYWFSEVIFGLIYPFSPECSLFYIILALGFHTVESILFIYCTVVCIMHWIIKWLLVHFISSLHNYMGYISLKMIDVAFKYVINNLHFFCSVCKSSESYLLSAKERTEALQNLQSMGWSEVTARDAIYKEFVFKSFNQVT